MTVVIRKWAVTWGEGGMHYADDGQREGQQNVKKGLSNYVVLNKGELES